MQQPIIRPAWLVAGFLIASGAYAGEQVPTTSDDAIAGHQIVTIDQTTGEMRAPTAHERRQLRESAKALKKTRQTEPRFASKKGFVAPATEAEAVATRKTLSNGGTAMRVPESYMSNLSATRDGNGQLHVQHQTTGNAVDRDAHAAASMEASDE